MAEIEPLDLLDIAPIVERLKDTIQPTFRQINTAADAAAASSKGQAIATPSATVVYLGASADEVQEGSGPLRQSFEVTIGVVIAIGLAGAFGDAAIAKMQGPLGLVRAALFGWSHPGAERKFWSGGESVDDFDPKTQTLYLRLDFVTRARIQEK